MENLLLVMAGGCLGASCRYGISLAAASLFGPRFPWGTLIVNLSGCFLIGLAFALAEKSVVVTPPVRLFFVTGFLGALTTFSTYAMETFSAAGGGSPGAAMINLAANNFLGLALVGAGVWIVRHFV